MYKGAHYAFGVLIVHKPINLVLNMQCLRAYQYINKFLNIQGLINEFVYVGSTTICNRCLPVTVSTH